MLETIVAAAVRIPVSKELRAKTWNDKRVYSDYLIVSSPPPARHHTLLHPLYDILNDSVPGHDTGFLTSTGRYVDRDEALDIAITSGQPMIDHPSRHATLLFSEDLW